MLPDLGEGLTEAEIVRWLVAGRRRGRRRPAGGRGRDRQGDGGGAVPVRGRGHRALRRGGHGTPRRRTADDGGRRGAAEPRRRRGAAGASGDRAGRDAPARPTSLRQRAGRLRHGAAPRRRRPPDRARRALAAPLPLPAPGRAGSPAPVRRPLGAAQSCRTGPVPVISPLVRRLARENGLDLRQLTGSGPDGLILRADVEHALRAPRAEQRAAPPSRDDVRAAGRPRPRAAGATAGRSAHPAEGRPRRGRRQALPQPAGDPRGDLLGGRRRHRAAAPRGPR